MDFSNKNITQIKEILAKREALSSRWLKTLECDPRPGVKRLALVYKNKKKRLENEHKRLAGLLAYETQCYAQGCEYVAGVDEVGRGPLAGPVLAAAVILPVGVKIPFLNDSKKLSVQRRNELAEIIKEKAVAWSVGIAAVNYIDKYNIYNASIKAMVNAVAGLNPDPQFVLVDALKLPGLSCPQKAIIHGDSLSASIAAASILAKVIRDELMEKYERTFPGYGFKRHKGYCTREHVEAIKKLGPCPIHRRSFQIVNILFTEGEQQHRVQQKQEAWEW